MLRDFQLEAKQRVYEAWAEPNVFNVMMVLPTGGGKTVTFCNIVSEVQQPSCIIAHRMELVAQASLALNREQIPHAVIAPKPAQQQIIRLHHETHGYSRYSYRADVRVAGVDSLPNHDTKDRWLTHVGLTVVDEGHHVVQNKWAKAMAMFPNARGLLPTGHALRGDGLGLGRHASGLVDRLVIGPSCRDLISRGFLTDYELLCPSTDIDFSHVEISRATGDYVQPQLRAATHASNRIVGDVIQNYLRYAPGKLGITFAVDVEEAEKLSAAYNKAGVSAEIITAKTPVNVRSQLMRQFRARQILMLVSVDCLGEGVDVPAIEVVILARKTASFQLYAQMVGRALRVMVSDELLAQWGSFTDAQRLAYIAAGIKPHALIIDPVGNSVYFAQYHGRVCSRQNYDLADRETRSRVGSEIAPLRTCTECIQPYERFLLACPYCGCEPIPAGRSTPDQVDGDLIFLDSAVLDTMRGQVRKVDGPCYMPVAAGPEARRAIFHNHTARQEAQSALRKAMQLWGGWRLHEGENERVAQRRFFHTFDIDVLSAQALGREDAGTLESKVRAQLDEHQIVEDLL